MSDAHDTTATRRLTNSTETLVDALRSAGCDFELLAHSETFSATAEAHVLGVLEESVAKTLVLRDDRGRHIRAVVPASRRLDLAKLAQEVDADEVKLLDEPELLGSYPQFELGAVPPFSGPAGDAVVVDRHLVDCDRVVIEAGVHNRSVRLRTEDLLTAADALVADIASD